MPLEELEIDFPAVAVPDRIATFLKEADRRIDRFFDENRGRRLPRYVPSDPVRTYSALSYISEHDLALGKNFCEWGSGFGVSACVASLSGYRSYGIEIERELAELSQKLASDLHIAVEIINTSYLPEGFESYLAHGGHRLMAPANLARRQRSLNYSLAYEDMDIEIEEVDVFYVYPWPEEQELMLELFEAVAAEDALLLAYYAQGDLNLYRKRLD